MPMSQYISTIPFKPGMYIRARFYKRALNNCGNDVDIHYGTLLSYPDISIGSSVRIGPFNTIAQVNIGDNVFTGQAVHLLSGSRQHSYERTDIPMNRQAGVLKTINIGNDVWIGAGAVVMADVGSGAVVGAGSVVVSPVEAFSVVAGNPAKVIKKRKIDERK